MLFNYKGKLKSVLLSLMLFSQINTFNRCLFDKVHSRDNGICKDTIQGVTIKTSHSLSAFHLVMPAPPLVSLLTHSIRAAVPYTQVKVK